MRPTYLVAFRGEFPAGEQEARQRLGLGVHAYSVYARDAFWPAAEPAPEDWDRRHLVTHVDADDEDDAVQRIQDALGRPLDGVLVTEVS